jgi:hypothetical protein
MTAIAPKMVDLAVDSIGGAFFNEVAAMLGPCGCISVVGPSAGLSQRNMVNTRTWVLCECRSILTVEGRVAVEIPSLWSRSDNSDGHFRISRYLGPGAGVTIPK